jgi:hypothetical protein
MTKGFLPRLKALLAVGLTLLGTLGTTAFAESSSSNAYLSQAKVFYQGLEFE